MEETKKKHKIYQSLFKVVVGVAVHLKATKKLSNVIDISIMVMSNSLAIVVLISW